MPKNKPMDYKTFMNSNEWRVQSHRVRKRDNDTCQLCGCKDKQMHAHHLKYLDDFTKVDDKDIITLCIECHRNLHNAKIELKNSLAEVYDHRKIERVISLLKYQSKKPAKKENKVVEFLKNLVKW